MYYFLCNMKEGGTGNFAVAKSEKHYVKQSDSD